MSLGVGTTPQDLGPGMQRKVEGTHATEMLSCI